MSRLSVGERAARDWPRAADSLPAPLGTLSRLSNRWSEGNSCTLAVLVTKPLGMALIDTLQRNPEIAPGATHAVP